MRIFGISEANYYCSSFGGSAGDAEESIDEFRRNHLGTRSHTIKEGTALFQEYRDCSLRDVERSLFFAASHYRRSLDLMIPSSSPWAHVTLYYGSWYASRGLLGMFGCTVFSQVVVDVGKGSPGQQELRLRRIGARQGQQPTTYAGSHRIFWDLFYTAVQHLVPMVEPRFAAVLSPVSGDRVWQIQHRNEVNYDSCIGCRLAEDFDRSFSRQGFPGCLPGVLSTQFRILETLLELVYSYARQFGLSTDALDGLGRPVSLRDKVRHLIYTDKPPGLVRKTRKTAVT
jgi:hypothetical protein